MLNLGCGQYLRNPFFPGFWGQKWGCGFCILADYTRLYTVNNFSWGKRASIAMESSSRPMNVMQVIAGSVFACLIGTPSSVHIAINLFRKMLH